MPQNLRLSFGERALTYDRLRPSYPSEVVAWALEGAPGGRVLDLGAGTGTLTRRLSGPGAVAGVDHLCAVEPDARMREVLSLSVAGVIALDGTAEAIPLPDGSIDCVLVGQAFHWFARPAADLEISRVLRPGGVLGILTNTNPDGADWEAVLHHRVLGFTQPSLTKQRAPLAPDVFTGEQTSVWDNPNDLNLDDFLELTSTWSWVATADLEQRRQAVLEAERLFAANAGSDDLLRLPYQLDVLRARRR